MRTTEGSIEPAEEGVPAVPTATSVLRLMGRDFPDLGVAAVVSHPCGGALALSRGRLPKPYAWVDPNEDAALLAHAPRGTVLAVADGFNGVAASELVLDEVDRAASRLLVREPGRFEEEVGALLRRVAARGTRLGRSRTCLVLVSVIGEICHVAGFGDSAAFRAGVSEPLVVPEDPPDWLVLGPEIARAGPPASRFSGSLRLAPGERIAVVSDGITNHLRAPGDVAGILARARDDREAVEETIEAALRGGAGDNVAMVAFCRSPLPTARSASTLAP